MSGRHETALVLCVALALALAWTLPLHAERSLGWDESMHAALPAARILVALQEGEIREASDALLGCSQYPFVYALVLALAQAFFGISEHVCRVAGTLVWVATLCGLFFAAREAVASLSRARGARRGDAWIPWLAFAFGALSPLALAFSGTLYLEVPSACATVWALHAWLARARPGESAGERRRDLAAGAWIAAACFTKYNYGLLLGLGLALDWLLEAARSARAREFARFARRSAWLAATPLAAGVWWFVWPLPGGLEIAAGHRAAFVEFLQGNLAQVPTPWEPRLLYASAYFAATPRLFALEVVAVLASAFLIRERAVRTLWLVLLAFAVPTEGHPFHLDRFLIPCGIAWWVLAAVGLARCLPAAWFARMPAVAALALLVLVRPHEDTLALAGRLGQLQEDPFLRAYQEKIFASWHDLSGGRDLPTGGIERAKAEGLLDAIATEVGPEGDVAWIGISSELSPAALHLGLLRRGGSRPRFQRAAHAPMDVAYFGVDPQWSDAELAAFGERFEVVLYTEPIDLKNRASRRFMADYAARLVQNLAWKAHVILRTELARPLGEPLRVSLHACRRDPR